MRIITPSYTILHDLDGKSLAERIEYCGRICYKSENLIDKDTALPFVEKMADHGHNSVLEMGVITFKLSGLTQQRIDSFLHCQPVFLQINRLRDDTLLITGSVRAYRELFIFQPDNEVIQAVTAFISRRHPYFYHSLSPVDSLESLPGIHVEKIELDEVDRLDPDLLGRHRYLGVKFTVNRAVTHELVRHRPCSFLQESQRYCRYSADKFGNEVTFIKPLFYQEDSQEYQLWLQAMEETEKLYLKLLETSTPQAARTVLPNSCKTEIIVYTNLVEWGHILTLRTPKNADPSMREVMIPLLEELKALFPGQFA
ncbi:MAG: FAD-dependent thymidylate synthase [Desulfobulbus propionicus]|nr:MAG: FAD-dependent thymidylate synthase [Desulfobulbus propionicus]